MGSDSVQHGRLTRADLMSLEQYSTTRKEFRGRVLDHKRNRLIAIGPNVTWAFEDRLTIQYQVQEMLRVERIFEAAGIQDELDAYNPLIPDGSNWKVTFLIEFPDPEERKQRLAVMKGIEDRCWVQVEGLERSFAIADEDLERENEEKTSSVHFLRFELSAEMASKVKSGSPVKVGIDHPQYNFEVQLSSAQRDSLARDLA
ncbi:DUF3501 family protein [Steroidobacter agaridevorans]|uniref:DUF3501 family protein n=1 Tax=Steroidobacter agaridevorans TaxID=2695856 RepID=UPI0013232031|nr:DUF3501 family protein [Steroidobacter agaridevorans]GFE90745.1 hypothetical protein GCM10011488_56990 [Steroidobacter agaridevorans]